MRGGLTFRVFGASVLLALVVAASFVLLLRAIAAQRDAASLAMHSQEVLSSANRLERLVLDLESSSRGYLLTGEPRFLTPWTAARAAIPGEEANLEALTQVPDQHQRAAGITLAIRSYLDAYSVPTVQAAQRGDLASARSTATADFGRTMVDDLRVRFTNLDDAERELALGRNAGAAATSRWAVLSASAGLGVSVLLVLLLATYLTRAIVRPVRRAAQLADRFAGGDLSTRIPETAVGEIQVLQRSFNDMGTSLERNRDELGRLLGEQAALRRVATLVAHGERPARVFTAVVEQAGQVLGLDGAMMLRLEPDGSATLVAGWGETGRSTPVGTRVSTDGADVVRLVVESGKPAWRAPQDDAGLTVGAPILVENRVWGVMIGLSTGTEPPPSEAGDRLAQFTDLVATAIANSQAREELTASRARVVVAGDHIRHRIERDLHDGTQQRLVSLALDLRSAEAAVPDDQPELREQLAAVATGLGAALDDLREIARGIHPAILTEGGLAPALRSLARRSAVPVELTTRIGERPPPALEIAAYYIVAESLTNAAKHARASVIRVEAECTGDGGVELSITDDGVGGADPVGGSGLVGLADRIRALGGRLDLTSPPGRGTRLRVVLPGSTS